jgi:hypothetical protein
MMERKKRLSVLPGRTFSGAGGSFGDKELP